MEGLRDAYRLRHVRFLELWEAVGWRLKVYGISLSRLTPSDALVRAAKSMARGHLPVPAVTDHRYGVGFLGVHEGDGSNLVFLDWWADVNELRHHVFVSYPAAPEALVDATPTGLAGCVWDLRLLGFERDAWVDTVLNASGDPDLERYLAQRFDGVL